MDGDSVRLAELVAALSLGIDLGFGQPMEHVLRQCLIALALAERVGLDDESRATVYYTALLVNVGCHSDAHEQAKWFGDDIALKAGKYDHSLGGVRAAASVLRLLGAGNPPLHRFKIGLEFALSGRREVDGMIESHARLARQLAEQLELTATSRRRSPARTSSGTAAGGPAACTAARSRSPRASPSSRSSPRSLTVSAESRPSGSSRTSAAASSSIPSCPRSSRRTPRSSTASTTPERGTR